MDEFEDFEDDLDLDEDDEDEDEYEDDEDEEDDEDDEDEDEEEEEDEDEEEDSVLEKIASDRQLTRHYLNGQAHELGRQSVLIELEKIASEGGLRRAGKWLAKHTGVDDIKAGMAMRKSADNWDRPNRALRGKPGDRLSSARNRLADALGLGSTAKKKRREANLTMAKGAAKMTATGGAVGLAGLLGVKGAQRMRKKKKGN